LQAERATDALELLREIQSVAPDFMEVSELITEAERLYALGQEYTQALQLYNQGSLEDALEIFKRIEEQEPGFRDTGLKIAEIEDELEIQRLFGVIDVSSQVQDWQAVIDAYDQILALDPTTSFDGLEEILFLGYLNLIREIAGSDDVTIDDIDRATEYYYNALALLPQNREFAAEREELQRVATTLIGNRYYLFAVDLLNSQGFSPSVMNEALRLLRLADNIGAGSPAITAAIEQAELFVTGYDALSNGRYGDAISQLEGLYRLDADYGDGMVQYLLYEAYTARGDLLYTYGDYVEARSDYELAETFGWGDYGNALRLFEVEIRIGFTLRRLYLLNEAAEYYNYAFSLIEFEEKAYQSGDNDLIATWEDAQVAFARNDEFNAARLFESVLEKIEVAYSFETVEVSRGDSIFEIAYNYGSTAQIIRDYNQLGVVTVFKVDQEITVPYIPEN
jgi:tetratricopeptide (TPR) repeat protein